MCYEVNTSELDDASYSHVGMFNGYRDMLGRFETKPVITLLCLELLGKPFLPVGTGKPFSEEAMAQVRAAYRNIGCLAVGHGDVRRKNVMKTSRTTGPSLSSSFSGQQDH
ncbi:hypothetical protein Hypma_012323 [Hypsizygus marmoreus]|uniref:Uncharacterized protein n=1 Tax=Hypsizygus marmoreus TaxID=39966 RepID=A0A369JLW5_HYPMA|nr:hypothetical protein Hypma_012323 [Hypsizygus marmoreus]